MSNDHGDASLGRARPTAPPSPLAPGRHEVGRAIVLVPPDPVGTLVFLHGAGGTAEDSERRIGRRALDAHLLTICPSSLGATWDLIVRGFGPDVAEIDHLIASVRGAVPPFTGPLVLAGFSDGASYALSVGLANGGVVDAIIAFSPGFALPPRTAGEPAVFISHGDRDPVLPVSCSRRIVAALSQRGTPPTYVEFDGGHEIPTDVMDAAFSWVTRNDPGSA
jgi:predicted esterase